MNTCELSRDQKQMLSFCIQAHHLSDDAINKLASTFKDNPDRYLIVDNFLQQPILDHVPRLLQDGEKLQTRYSIYKGSSAEERSEFVTKEVFDKTPEHDKFIQTQFYDESKVDADLGDAIKMDKLFRTTMRNPAFYSFLEKITGIPVGATQNVNLKKFGMKDFLKKHNDTSPRRVLCLFVYIHKNWQPDFNGRFIMHKMDGTQDVVEPITNRLVLFDTNVGTSHEVEPLAGIIGDWRRLNYTVWFGGPL